MIAFKSSFLALAFSTLTVAQYGGGGSGGASSTATSAAPSATSTTTNNVTDVLVGNGGLVFTPNTVQAKVGDTINFHFYPTGHSVAESAFNSPCSYMKGGIWSGSVSSSSGVAANMFSVTINDTNPHWLYCAQTIASHCQNGMVMVINPPADSQDTLAAYKSAAAGTKVSTAGTVVEGGVIEANAASPSTASTSSTALPRVQPLLPAQVRLLLLMVFPRDGLQWVPTW